MKIKVRQLWTAGMDKADGPYIIESNGASIDAVEAWRGGSFDIEIDGVAVPGLIDCHDHIGIDVGDEHAQSIDEAGRLLIKGTHTLREIVANGVTTIRDCGDRADIEGFWIEGLERGWLVGPRVVRSQTPIARTGGHAWYLGDEADGVYGVRSAVRRRLKAGADFIKVMVTGGNGTIGSNPVAAEYTPEELHALIDEAHRFGLKVSGHGHGGPGIDDAIDAGVDSIEHGTMLTVRQLERMAANSVVLDVTQAIGLAFATDPAVPESIRETASTSGRAEKYQDVIRAAREAGVKVVLGSDCVHGKVGREAVLLSECGYSPVECLTAATASGADLVGDSRLGRIEPGAAADILFVSDDPTTDISAIESVTAVLASGSWVK